MTAATRDRKSPKRQGSWSLTDAKARFSEVVQLAQDRPQRVTRHGHDAVVIVAAAQYDREHAHSTGADLVRAFAHPALTGFDLHGEPIVGSHRDIEL